MSQPDRLHAGDRLLPGQSLLSANGQYIFRYQTDGNLVIYENRPGGRSLWATQTSGVLSHYLLMREDGCLALYCDGGDGEPSVTQWSTGTAGDGGRSPFFILQNDGNAVIYARRQLFRAGGK